MPWTLTVRGSGRVERAHFDALEPLLDAAEARVRELSNRAPRRPADLRYKQIEAGQQVFARIELTGPERFMPSVRAGVDIRGDGFAEPYAGRVRRRVIESRTGESAVGALRRALRES